MVTKTRPYRYDASYSYLSATLPPGQVPVYLRQVSTISGTDTITHSGPVPAYKQQIAAGNPATSSLSGEKTSVVIQRDTTRYRLFDKGLNTGTSDDRVIHNYRSGDLCATNVSGIHPATLSETEANNLAISSFISKARSAQAAISGGTVLGELRETLMMIRRPASALRTGVSAYLAQLRKFRRRFRYKWDFDKYAGGLWLEYQFGWKPLVRDIEDGVKALNREFLGKRKLVRVSASGKTESAVLSPPSLQNQGSISWHVNTVNLLSCIVVYKGAVYCKVGNTSSASLENWGLSTKDFVPTVWELIPYSFIVDYFTNIGDILSACSFASSNFAWKQKTVIKSSLIKRQACNFSFIPPAQQQVVEDQAGGGKARSEAEVRTVNRVLHSGLLIPQLELQVPGMSSPKWLNLTALAVQHRSLSGSLVRMRREAVRMGYTE